MAVRERLPQVGHGRALLEEFTMNTSPMLERSRDRGRERRVPGPGWPQLFEHIDEEIGVADGREPAADVSKHDVFTVKNRRIHVRAHEAQNRPELLQSFARAMRTPRLFRVAQIAQGALDLLGRDAMNAVIDGFATLESKGHDLGP